MIQDIYPHRLRNEFVPNRPLDEEGYAFLFRGGEVLCRFESDRVSLPRVRELSNAGEYRFLFTLDNTPCFLAMDAPEEAPAGWEYAQVRALRNRAAGPRELIFAAWTAFQLANWYRDNRFAAAVAARPIPPRTSGPWCATPAGDASIPASFRRSSWA